MCLGIPMQVISCADYQAICRAGAREESVDLALVGPQVPGTWLLVFLGAAREVLDEAEAEKITRALDGLSALMTGGSLGDAFADLEAREPELPPHLEAARRAGRLTA